MSDNDLREALAKIKDGDEVTVTVEYAGDTYTVIGKARERGRPGLRICTMFLRCNNGDPGPLVTAVLDHKPHVPEVTAEVLDALPVYAVVTDSRDVPCVKHENGNWNGLLTSSNLLAYAPLTIQHPKEA